MPIDYQKYPAGWHAFSRLLRTERDKGLCQCQGHCGAVHWKEVCGAPNHQHIVRCYPDSPQHWFLFEEAPESVLDQVVAAGKAITKVVLTVAHLCDCLPLCAIPDHCLSLCQYCHLRMDQDKHQRHSAETRRRTLADAGQLSFLLLPTGDTP